MDRARIGKPVARVEDFLHGPGSYVDDIWLSVIVV